MQMLSCYLSSYWILDYLFLVYLMKLRPFSCCVIFFYNEKGVYVKLVECNFNFTNFFLKIPTSCIKCERFKISKNHLRKFKIPNKFLEGISWTFLVINTNCNTTWDKTKIKILFDFCCTHRKTVFRSHEGLFLKEKFQPKKRWENKEAAKFCESRDFASCHIALFPRMEMKMKWRQFPVWGPSERSKQWVWYNPQLNVEYVF